MKASALRDSKGMSVVSARAVVRRHANDPRRLCALIAGLASAVMAFSTSPGAYAQTTYTKANNLNDLNLTSSWTTGTAPTASDVALFDSTYATAGTLNSTAVSWGGIQITNPGVAVVINNGAAIGVGSSGIDMSSATVDLTLQRFQLNASQEWDVDSGRTFRLGNSSTARSGVFTNNSSGATITKSGAGSVNLDMGNASLGNVNWTINDGLIRAIWNEGNAWGTGSITLGGGGIATGTPYTGSVGNWTWNNNVSLTAATSSYIDNQNIAGADRWLKLTGIISGSGNLEFRDTGTGFNNANFGFILAGANTNTGTVTIATNAEVRVGATTGSGNANTGNAGTIGAATAPVVNNGLLSFSRLDTHTVANTISGTGRVRVGLSATIGTATGSQDLTLSGVNSYSGGTELLNGTLRVSALSGIGSGYLAVKNGASFIYTGSGTESTTRNLFMDAGAATINVSDAAGSLTWTDGAAKNQSFTKTGAGTLAIGGAFISGAAVRADGGTLRLTSTNSSYTGTTTMAAGVLEVSKLADGGANSSIGASGTAAENLVFSGGGLSYIGAGDSTNRAFTITSAPTIHANGSGALTWTGASPTFTTGNTPYQVTLGGTNAEANTFGTILADNGSGATSLRKAGTGTWVLSGVNTFTGTVGIAGGTLEIGGAGLLGSGSYAAAIVNDGTLSVATSADQTLAGVVSGAGGLAKSGVGRLALTAVNTYAGSTTITSGTVVVAGAGQLGGGAYAGAITNDGALEFTTSADQSLSGGIGGSGTLRKAGTGRLTLLGSSTYAGATAVEAGTLLVNGQVTASEITVSGGAILAGSGTMANVVLSGGVVSPGNSPGTQTVADMSWDASSSYTWEMYDYQAGAGTGWDQIDGTGALTVTGTGFTFNLVSLSGTNTPGPAFNWSQTTSGTFRVATFAGGITTPGGTWYTIDTGSFTPFSGLTGAFSLATGATTLDLVYTYTPPPSYEWTGGTGSWSVGSNWNTDPVVPEGTAELIFSGAGGTSTNDLVSGTGAGELSVVTGITFSGSATGSYTIAGDAFNLGSIGIVNQSSSQQTIQDGLTLASASLANADTAALVLSGTLETAGYLFTVTGSSATTLSGVVTGSGGLAKLGAGTLTLGGANDFTGGTLISSGTVVVGDGATAGVLPGNVTNNATLVFDRTDDVTMTTGVIGTGSLTKLNANTLTLTGSSGYSGATTIAGGTLAFASDADQTLSGAISGSGALAKAGIGSLTLSGSSDYTGGTTISSGTLQLGSGGTTGSITGDVANAGVLAFNRSDAVTFSGTISGTGSVTQAGGGSTTLTGVNTYAGDTTITSGTLAIGGSGQLGGGTYAAAIANAGVFSIETSANQTLSGTVSGIGSVRKSGAGVLTLTAANSYAAGTTLSAGTIRIGNDAALGTGTVTFDGGGLSSDGATARAPTNALVFSGDATLGNATDNGPLTFSGGADLGGAVRQVTVASDVTMSAAVTNGGLTKTGAATLTLTAANSYAAGTTLSAGTIRIGNDAALGTGTVTFDGGGLSSDGATARAPTNALAFSGDATLGNATDNGPLTFSGGADLGGAVRQVTVASDVTMSGVLTNGGLTKAGAATLALTGASNYTGATTISSGTLRFTGSGNIASTSGVEIAAGAVFEWGRAAAVSRVFSGSGTILRSTAGGNATFSGVSPDFEGSWLVTAGFVGLTSDAVVGASTVGMTWSGGQSSGIFFTAGGNTLAATRTITLSGAGGALNGSTGNTNTFASVFTGTGMLYKVSGERAILTAVNDFTGGINITGGGVFEIGGSGKLGGSSGVYNGAISNANTLDFNTSADQTLGGVISGGGALIKRNSGTLTVTNTNSLSGGVTLSAGQLNIDHARALGTGTFTIAGGSIDNTSADDVVLADVVPQRWNGDFTFVGTDALDLGAGAVALGASRVVTVTSSVLTVGGSIGGAFSLTKDGAGTLLLTGTSGYTGATDVDAGTLLVDGSLATSALTVADVATLMGSGSIAGDATILGTHRPGNSPGIQSFGSGLTYDGATLVWDLTGNTATQTSPTPTFDQVLVAGDLDFATASTMELVFSDGTVDWFDIFWDSDQEWLVYDVGGTTTDLPNLTITVQSWEDSFGTPFANVRPDASFSLRKAVAGEDVYLVYSAIPEPGAGILAGIGLAAAGWLARRRRSTA